MTEHGTYSHYVHQKCRCELCRSANAEHSRKRSEEKPRTAYNQQYRIENIERERENKRKWRAENPQMNAAAQGRYRKSNPWRLHHINRGVFTALLDSQGGTCAGCGITMEEYGRVFDIDHDHACCPGRYSCGKCIRGLICRSCNLRDVLAAT